MKTRKQIKAPDPIKQLEKKMLNGFKLLGDHISDVQGQLSGVRLSVFDIQDKVEEVQKQVSHLPTKEEYYAREDKTATELHKMRENMEVMTGWKDQMEDLEIRVETVETRLKISPKN
ncbi:MAG: hypothetical protein NUV98_00285 [Candidatus Roizmanbacteria bacterium]|nr:hypothetical protein [Candidatus Roizmanbacteria bacterium]